MGPTSVIAMLRNLATGTKIQDVETSSAPKGPNMSPCEETPAEVSPESKTTVLCKEMQVELESFKSRHSTASDTFAELRKTYTALTRSKVDPDVDAAWGHELEASRHAKDTITGILLDAAATEIEEATKELAKSDFSWLSCGLSLREEFLVQVEERLKKMSEAVAPLMIESLSIK